MSGTTRPRRTGLLIAAVIVVVVVVAAAAVMIVRTDDDPTPAERPTPGGVMTGQADQLADALTAQRMECSVRYTFTQAAVAGCFGQADNGDRSTAVRFQYTSDGAVIAVDATSSSEQPTALATLVKATASVVFPDDADAADAALASAGSVQPMARDGRWGKYKAENSVGGTTFSAARTDARPVTIPSQEMTTTAAQLQDALQAKGFTCGAVKAAADASCGSTYRDGKGRVRIRSYSLGPKLNAGGVTILEVSAEDASKDRTAAATEQAFTDVTATALGAIETEARDDLARWAEQHRDGQFHSAYVGGWRVTLSSVKPADTSVPLAHRLRVVADTNWNTPD
ncbi:hypothetical protein [Kribbella sp. NPDC049227]|uniref:hypothetical protein n=1 Tax=Kribbella sp. NPDC049227 TaxID=3364113 RepID=UPI003713312D